MKSLNYIFLYVILFSIILLSCETDEMLIPKAVIEINSTTAAPLDTIYLDGTNSENANSYQWEINYGNVYFISTSDDNSKGYFIAETTGQYYITLTVTQDLRFDEISAEVIVSGAITLSGTLSQSMTLTNVNTSMDSADYIILDDLIIPEGMTLTINPDVVIDIAENKSIIVSGNLYTSTSQSGGYFYLRALSNTWKGIHVKSGTLDLYYGYIMNAGSSSFSSEARENASIYFESGTNHNLNTVYIKDGSGFGLVMNDGTGFSGSDNLSIYFDNNASGIGIFTATTLQTNLFYNISVEGPDIIEIRGSDSKLYGSIGLYNRTFKILSTLIVEQVIISDATIIFSDGAGLEFESGQISGSDLSGETQTPGSWKGIFQNIQSNSSVLYISNSKIQHGGSSAYTTADGDFSGGVVSNGGSIQFENSTISNNSGYGLVIANFGIIGNTLNTGDISNNSMGAVRCPVEEVTLFANSNITFSNYNSAQPIFTIKGSRPGRLGASVWPKLASTGAGIDYLVDEMITIGSTYSLTIEPNVQVYFEEGASITVNGGKLDAQGSSADNKVNFRANGSGAGLWNGIYIGSSSTIILDHVDINMGGSDVSGSYQGCLNLASGVNSSASSIKNTFFLNGGSYDLYFLSATDELDVMNVANNNSWTTTNL